MPARRSLTALLAGMTMLATLAAQAQVSCALQLPPVSFGSVDLIGSLPADRTLGSIAVQCGNSGASEATLLIDIRVGTGVSGSDSERRMTGPGGATLAYNLFRDAARTQPWRASGNPAAALRVPANASATLHQTVFGRVYGPRDAPPGVYTDVLLTIVEF